MRIHNEIELQAPADELFAFLSDVERVGPCLPGATIEGQGRGGLGRPDEGQGRADQRDLPGQAALPRARQGRAARGHARTGRGGRRPGQRRGEHHDRGGGRGRRDSVIRMDTDLQIRGKVAQFGRGAMEKISQRMFEQFAGNIEQAFNGNGAAAPEPSDEAASSRRPRQGPRRTATTTGTGRRSTCSGCSGTPASPRRPGGGRGAGRPRLRIPVRPAAGVAGHGAAAGAAAVSPGADPLDLPLVEAAAAVRAGRARRGRADRGLPRAGRGHGLARGVRAARPRGRAPPGGRARRRRARGPLHGVPVGGQGHHRRRRAAHTRGLGRPRRRAGGARRAGRGPAARGRRGHPRQDRDARARLRRHHAGGRQPLGPGPQPGRLQRRLGGGGRDGRGARRRSAPTRPARSACPRRSAASAG